MIIAYIKNDSLLYFFLALGEKMLSGFGNWDLVMQNNSSFNRKKGIFWRQISFVYWSKTSPNGVDDDQI